MHRIIKIIVPLLLILAFLAAVAWAIFAPDFEPAITSLALLASLTAIFADRWVNSRERRKELLRALAHELYMNIGTFKDLKTVKKKEHIKKPHVYPRLYTTTLANVIASGMFTGPNDRKLWKLMNGWLQKSTDFNNRLNVTETQVFSNPDDAEIFNKKITEGRAATEAMAEYKKLLDVMMKNYKIESEIDYEAMLFEDE